MFYGQELDRLIGFYGTDYLGLAEAVKQQLERGDFNTIWSRFLARRLFRKAMKEHELVQLNTPEGLVKRQTLAAEGSALAAYIAICVSVLALGISVMAYIKPLESPESVKPTNPTQIPLTAGKAPQKPASAIAPK